MHWAVLCLAFGFIATNRAADFLQFTDTSSFEQECDNKIFVDNDGYYYLKITDKGSTKKPLALIVDKTNGFDFNIKVNSIQKVDNHDYRVDLDFKNVDARTENDDNILHLAWEPGDNVDRVLYRKSGSDNLMEDFGSVAKSQKIAVFHLAGDGTFTMENSESSGDVPTMSAFAPNNGITHNSTHSILLLDVLWAYITKPIFLMFHTSSVTLGCMVSKKTTTPASKQKETWAWAIVVGVIAIVLIVVVAVVLGLLYKFGILEKCICKCCRKKKPKSRKNKQGITRPQPLTLSEDKEFDRIRKAPSGKGFIIVPIPTDVEGVPIVPMTSAEQESLMRPSQEPTHDSTGTNGNNQPVPTSHASQRQSQEPADALVTSEAVSKSSKDPGKNESGKSVKDKKEKVADK